jgi:hypothetical protein
VLNNWQISGVLTAGSAAAYDLTYSYQNNGGNVNITGSPDYGGRIVFTGDPGSGCSSDQYKQFNTAAVTGAQPGSVGLESGRNIMRGCMDKTVDMALAKNIPLGGQRNLQFRMDVFNLFNTYIINGRSTNVQFTSPTNLTVVNSQFNAGAQTIGQAAGLGNNYNRVMMLQVRFQF